jgi:HlyD family secretion protein
VLVAAAAVLLAVLVAWGVSGSTGPRIDPGLMAEVKRGPLIVSITERGDLEAERKKVISNDLRWPSIIKQVLPDGTTVKEGDLIVQFECKELNDAIIKTRLDVASAENLYTESSENLKMKKKDLANKVVKAEHALLDAQQNLLRYKEGEGPVNLRQAQSAVDLAKQELALAQKELEFMQKVNALPEMADNKPYSKKDLDAKELEVRRKEAAVENAQAKVDMINAYDDQKQLRILKDAITDTQLQLEQAHVEEKTQLLVGEATTQTRKSTLEMNKSNLGLLLEDEAKLLVKAAQSGLVIYKINRHPWEQSRATVAVGEKIESRQQLMIIPDMTSLQINTKISEALKDQVTLGMEAFIRLDAKPDTVLKGSVKKISPVPESQGWWASRNMKVYTVIVEVDPNDRQAMKPEMTSKVEIVLAKLDNVLTVPIASVFSEQEQTYCWRVNGGSRQRVPVKVGRMSDTTVEIASGLSEGDKVLLVPPSEEGEAEQGNGNGGGPPGDKAKTQKDQGKPAKQAEGGGRS